MKRITIPQDATDVPVTRRTEDGPQTVIVDKLPFAHVVCQVWLNADTWSRSGESPAARTKTMRLAIELQERFESVKGGDQVDISDEAHARLVESMDPALFAGTRTVKPLMQAGYWTAVEEAEDVEDEDAAPEKPAPKPKPNGRARKKKTGGKGRRKRA